MAKNPPVNAGDARDMVLILGSGRYPGGGTGHPLWYSCLENPMTEKRGRLQCLRLHRVKHNLSDLAAAAAKSLQSCPTLCNPIDGSPPGSPIPGILRARTLEWVAISFSNARKWKVKVKLLSRVWLLEPPGLQPARPLRPWDFPGKSTGVGCHRLPAHMHIYYCSLLTSQKSLKSGVLFSSFCILQAAQ